MALAHDPPWELSMRRIARISAGLATTAAATIGIASCDLGLWGPSGPGVIEMTLISPYGPEGAAVLEFTGGVGLSVVASEFGDTFYEHQDGISVAVVVLDEPGVIRFTVRTDDIGAIPKVKVSQVADGADQLRSSVSGYRVEFEQHEELSSDQQLRSP